MANLPAHTGLSEEEREHVGNLAHDLVQWSERGKGNFPQLALYDWIDQRIAAAVEAERQKLKGYM